MVFSGLGISTFSRFKGLNPHLLQYHMQPAEKHVVNRVNVYVPFVSDSIDLKLTQLGMDIEPQNS